MAGCRYILGCRIDLCWSRCIYWGVKLNVNGKSKTILCRKKVVILGLAKSGVAIAKIMKAAGASVVVNDRKPEKECQGIHELRELGIPVLCGSHPEDLIDSTIDLVIKIQGFLMKFNLYKKPWNWVFLL